MADTSVSSQDFIPIKDIRDGVVVMKDGKLCAVLLASSINFALKSADEQRAVLQQFQSFLNTIDFSIQIFVQSRRLDIRPYMDILKEREPEQYNDLMRTQLREYMDFIQTFTNEVDVMKKEFFVVVPYTPVPEDVTSGIKNLIGKQDKGQAALMERFEEHRTQLEQRVSVVDEALKKIGVRTAALGSDELIELYYHLFNPEDTAKAPQR